MHRQRQMPPCEAKLATPFGCVHVMVRRLGTFLLSINAQRQDGNSKRLAYYLGSHFSLVFCGQINTQISPINPGSFSLSLFSTKLCVCIFHHPNHPTNTIVNTVGIVVQRLSCGADHTLSGFPFTTTRNYTFYRLTWWPEFTWLSGEDFLSSPVCESTNVHPADGSPCFSRRHVPMVKENRKLQK